MELRSLVVSCTTSGRATCRECLPSHRRKEVRRWEGGREGRGGEGKKGGRERLRLNGSVGEEVGGREGEVEVEWKCR